MPDEEPFPYQQFVQSLEARAEVAGLSWPEVCREARSPYWTEEEDKPLLQFLFRFGVLPTTRPSRRNDERLREFLQRLEAPDGDEALSALRLFSGACKRAADLAVCGNPPSCTECCLRSGCVYYHKGPTLKGLPENERPRERLIQGGERSLSNAELVGIIIRDGTPNHTAVDLAKILLSRHGDLRSLAGCTIAELCEVAGIGPAKAAQIKAALTIGLRLVEEEGASRTDPFRSSQDVFDRYHVALRDLKKEVFKVILLDRRNRTIRDVDVSTGSLSASIVHPREVLNPAIRESAAAIICVHNHPSGDPRPSKEDNEITVRLAEAGKILGISLLDHIIIGDGCYYSFADEGRLKPE